MRRFANAVLSVLILLMVLLFIAWNLVPRAMGLHPEVVLTGSMEPRLPVGTVTFVHSLQPESARVGDVVTYRSPKNNSILITHRVVGFLDDGRGNRTFLITKGDANPAEDNPVPIGNVVGEVKYTIPHAGAVARRVSSRLGFVVLVLGPAMYLVAAEVSSMIKVVKDHRRSHGSAA